MSRTHKLINLAGIILPFVGLVAAIVFLWDRMVGPTEGFAILAVGYLLTGVGITVGYHRLFTHRSFETYRPVRYTFAVLGQMAVEGDVLAWVSDHRKHHQFSDQVGDPHSPRARLRRRRPRGAQGSLACPHRLALLGVGPRRPGALREGPDA